MTIKVGALEAKNKFSELMETVAYTKQRVLVVRRGKPMAAIVGVVDLARLETMETEASQKNRQKEIDEYFAEARTLRAWWLDKLGGGKSCLLPLIFCARLAKRDLNESLR